MSVPVTRVCARGVYLKGGYGCVYLRGVSVMSVCRGVCHNGLYVTGVTVCLAKVCVWVSVMGVSVTGVYVTRVCRGVCNGCV